MFIEGGGKVYAMQSSKISFLNPYRPSLLQ